MWTGWCEGGGGRRGGGACGFDGERRGMLLVPNPIRLAV